MAHPRLKSWLKLFLKLALTGIALYIVLRNIDLQETKRILFSSHPLWLLVGVLFFNGSKVVSAFRFRRFVTCLGIHLPWKYNLHLYYLGMFYNLFLPGGIGGDGYKVYLLRQREGSGTRRLVTVTLLDRLSGLAALVFLSFVLVLFSSWQHPQVPVMPLALAGALLTYPAWWVANRILFRSYLPVFAATSLQSIGVQGLQVVCSWFLLLALGAGSHFIDYLSLFLLSSIAAVLPFTIGGVGARELVFLLGTRYLPVDKNTAIAFSLLFFLITAASSLAGILFDAQKVERAAAPDTEEKV